MLCTSLLIATALSVPAIQSPPPDAQAKLASAERDTLNADLVLRGCDRLVVARVAKIQEFDRKPGSLGQATPPKIRIAELDTVIAPFGSMTERLLVRLPEGTTPPELGVWPLGHNLKFVNDDWDAFARAEKELHADPLWMPWSSNEAPWPTRSITGAQEVLVPGFAFGSPREREYETDARADKPPSRWIKLKDLEGALAEELRRVSPRTEASIVSTGPSPWHAEVQGNGNGVFNRDTAFAWNDRQRVAWDQALATFDFAMMPTRVGSSTGPCEAVLVLSRVTSAGRRTVRYYGKAPRNGLPDPWGPRFEGLWDALLDQLPKQSR